MTNWPEIQAACQRHLSALYGYALADPILEHSGFWEMYEALYALAVEGRRDDETIGHALGALDKARGEVA